MPRTLFQVDGKTTQAPVRTFSISSSPVNVAVACIDRVGKIELTPQHVSWVQSHVKQNADIDSQVRAHFRKRMHRLVAVTHCE